MNTRYIFLAVVLISSGVWIYFAQSLLDAEETNGRKKIIIKEGIERTDAEVAAFLAKETGFDIEGAFTTGYTTGDVIDYLMRQPHKYPVSYYQGRYYEGRITVTRIYPVAVSSLLIITGVVILILKGRGRK